MENSPQILALISRFCDELGCPTHTPVLISAYENGTLNIITAHRDGLLVGISGYYVNGRTAHGEVWYVLPEYRRSGVAHDLFARAHEAARQQGCGSMVVSAKRQRANLYLKHGYQEAYVLMSREL
jgi:GNAT superfamily N-acetyltransferase